MTLLKLDHSGKEWGAIIQALNGKLNTGRAIFRVIANCWVLNPAGPGKKFKRCRFIR
jgi:hypothetical protein